MTFEHDCETMLLTRRIEFLEKLTIINETHDMSTFDPTINDILKALVVEYSDVSNLEQLVSYLDVLSRGFRP